MSVSAGRAYPPRGPTAYACPRVPWGWSLAGTVAAGNYVYNVNLSHLDEWATLPELRQIGQVKRTDALWVFMDPNCEYLRPVGVGGGWFCLVTADWNNVNGGQTWPHGKFPIDGVANVVMLDGHVESFNQTTHRANYLANPPRPPLYQWGDAQ